MQRFLAALFFFMVVELCCDQNRPIAFTMENTFLRLIEFYVTSKCKESTASLNRVVLQISGKHSVSHTLTTPEKL